MGPHRALPPWPYQSCQLTPSGACVSHFLDPPAGPDPTISCLGTIPTSFPVPNYPFSLWQPPGGIFPAVLSRPSTGQVLNGSSGKECADNPLQPTLGRPARHSHHRAGIAAPLAALADEEGAIPLAAQHFLSLCAVDLAHIPCAFFVVGEVVLILHQCILAAGAAGRRTGHSATSRQGLPAAWTMRPPW